MHSNIDSVASGQVRIKGHLCKKICLEHMKNITDLFAISITNIYITPASNSAYLPPQDYFSWMPNSFWDPQSAKQSCRKNRLVWAMLKCMVSMATPYMILKNGGSPTKSIISRVLLTLEH